MNLLAQRKWVKMAKNSIFWHKKLRQIQIKNISKLDFCKDTPMEPRKKLVRFVRLNFGTLGFGATFYAKKCYFCPFLTTFSGPNFTKTHQSLKTINIHHSQQFDAAYHTKMAKNSCFWAKKCYFWPFFDTFSASNFPKFL